MNIVAIVLLILNSYRVSSVGYADIIALDSVS